MDPREGPEQESHPNTSLRRVKWAQEIDTVRGFFKGYRDWLADHQEATGPSGPAESTGLGMIDELIAGLPGAYGPPRGDVFFGVEQETIVACGALRELEPEVAEIKRLYVREDHRGPGFGTRLTSALLDRARDLDYARVRVDTLPTMFAAIQFYQDLGFKPIPQYWPHPAPGALFFEFKVAKSASAPRRDGATKIEQSRK